MSSADEQFDSRFLRARRFDPDRALKQFSDAEAWRKQHNVDELYRTFPVEEMELAKKYYPTWTGRRDMVGIDPYHCFGRLTMRFIRFMFDIAHTSAVCLCTFIDSEAWILRFRKNLTP